jgi:hypothetical protein
MRPPGLFLFQEHTMNTASENKVSVPTAELHAVLNVLFTADRDFATVRDPIRILIEALLDVDDYEDWAQFALLELKEYVP